MAQCWRGKIDVIYVNTFVFMISQQSRRSINAQAILAEKTPSIIPRL